MKGNGKGGDPRKNRRKHSRRQNDQSSARGSQQHGEGSKSRGKGRKSIIAILTGEGKFTRKRTGSANRLKWVAPQPPALNLAPALCILCNKPIREFSTAFCDPDTGKPAHFDCTVNRIVEKEKLEKGDSIGYIGGGRFGIIHFTNPQNPRKFTIKKIFEWEKNESRSEWRVALCEHFSIT